jgi:hypothetical protein
MKHRFALANLAILAAIVMSGVPSRAATQEADRPRCTSQNTGEFYPTLANKDHALAQKLVRCGQLEICARTNTWRYHWQYLSVTLDQLAARKNREVQQPSACSVKLTE